MMATQTLTGTGRTRPSSIFFKNPEVSIAQVTVTPAEGKKPELTAEAIKLQAKINSRFDAHIPSQIAQLKPAPPSYIPKEYEDTIDLNHQVAKQARTSYLNAVKTYHVALGAHQQELSAYYNGDHLWKEMPAPPTCPKTYEEYFKVCKEQYDIVEASEQAYAAAVAAKPSSELPKKPEPVFTPPDKSTFIRCSTEEDFKLQIQRAKDGLIESNIKTIVHPSLRTVYHININTDWISGTNLVNRALLTDTPRAAPALESKTCPSTPKMKLNLKQWVLLKTPTNANLPTM
jgi:hypothetical protein